MVPNALQEIDRVMCRQLNQREGLRQMGQCWKAWVIWHSVLRSLIQQYKMATRGPRLAHKPGQPENVTLLLRTFTRHLITVS